MTAIDFTVEMLKPFIDWTPFFQSWQLAGKYPAILEDKVVGKEATELLQHGLEMLDKIQKEGWLQMKGVYGFFPANAEGNDVIIWKDENRNEEQARLHFLRQQRKKADGLPYYCLSDYIVPADEEQTDYIGMFAVTAGLGIESHIKNFESQHDDYNAILLKSLADRLAEAAAEYLHFKTRTQYWAYAPEENLDYERLIGEKYRGIRPAPGYPACPDHTQKDTIWTMLDVEANTGIQLTESKAMYPAASVSGFYFSHPDARYFGLGAIGKDQIESLVARSGKCLEEWEKWLAPNLNYKSFE